MAEIKWKLVTKKVSELKPYHKNPRSITEQGLKDLKKSVDKFGLAEPIIINTDNTIIGGHARYLTLKRNNKIECDCYIPNRKLNDKEVEELNIRLNKNIAGVFDFDILANQFEMDDLLEWGFTEKELTGLDFGNSKTDEELDKVPEPPKVAVSKTGDIFLLDGKHRVMCGDSTKEEDVEKLMDDKKADMVFTDPPYNVAYSNVGRPKPSKKDLGRLKNDKMDVSEYKVFILQILSSADLSTKKDCSLYLWYASASASASAILNAFDESKWERNQEIIWKKPMLLGRGRYQWAHEPCIFAIKGSPFFTTDRTKTTVWDIGGYDKSKNVHPTQKPIKLCQEGIINSARQDDIVLDLFLGSGSTLIACEQTNRICCGMEIDPIYIDVILKRYHDLYPDKPIECLTRKLNFDKLFKTLK